MPAACMQLFDFVHCALWKSKRAHCAWEGHPWILFSCNGNLIIRPVLKNPKNPVKTHTGHTDHTQVHNTQGLQYIYTRQRVHRRAAWMQLFESVQCAFWKSKRAHCAWEGHPWILFSCNVNLIMRPVLKNPKIRWKHTQGTQDTPKYTVLRVYSTYILGRGYICQLLACSCLILYNVRSENPKGRTVHERDTPGFYFHAMLTWLWDLCWKIQKSG